VSVQDDLCQVAEQAAAVFEGFKIEVVGGQVVMTPQSDIQSWTIRRVQNSAEAAGIAEERLVSDVLINFPGEPPRAPDVAILEDGATAPYSYEDLLVAVEIVSTPDDDNDYSVKLRQYARFGVPTYVIIDPFRAKCTVLTRPKDTEYASSEGYAYGETLPLQLSDGSAVRIPTDRFKSKS
jgi:Uma2 family endonuclease